MAKVTVRGDASVPAVPDEVVVGIETVALEPSAADAVQILATRATELQAVLDELGIPRDHVLTAGITVHEEQEYNGHRYVHRGYRARSHTTVRLAEAATLARLLTEATRRAQARVGGPSWRVLPDNPAWEHVRRAAAQDARRRASAYAGALGLRLGAVDEIIEPGLRAPDVPRVLGVPTMATMSAESADVPVESAGLQVNAAIEVTFLLEDS